MKTVNYTRMKHTGKTLCTMEFTKGPAIVLDFGKKDGGKLKLPTDFIVDAIEHYLMYAINRGLKEHKNATKSRKK